MYLNILNLQDLLTDDTLDRAYKHYTLLRYFRFYLHVFYHPRLCPACSAGSKILHFRSSIRQDFLLKLLGSDANTGSCISLLILMCIARSNYLHVRYSLSKVPVGLIYATLRGLAILVSWGKSRCVGYLLFLGWGGCVSGPD
jgi:multidrug transporter EmrE-like cation transporter